MTSVGASLKSACSRRALTTVYVEATALFTYSTWIKIDGFIGDQRHKEIMGGPLTPEGSSTCSEISIHAVHDLTPLVEDGEC